MKVTKSRSGPVAVLGGTADGRRTAELLSEAGIPAVYSSVSGINAPDEKAWPGITNHTGAMDEDAMAAWLAGLDARLCVDATHPYAREVSINAMAACAQSATPYLRLERRGIAPDRDDLVTCDSYAEAVAYLAAHEGRILTTTGSRELEAYNSLPKERLILRVLPTSRVLAKCEALGYKPANIIAMQGPFSREINLALLRAFDIAYLVTKDSGDVGGVEEKLEAARACGVTVLCIGRPSLDYPAVCATPEEAIQWIAGRDQ
jgi:precorrin-6A/cobalt-precorrin-6A reductase